MCLSLSLARALYQRRNLRYIFSILIVTAMSCLTYVSLYRMAQSSDANNVLWSTFSNDTRSNFAGNMNGGNISIDDTIVNMAVTVTGQTAQSELRQCSIQALFKTHKVTPMIAERIELAKRQLDVTTDKEKFCDLGVIYWMDQFPTDDTTDVTKTSSQISDIEKLESIVGDNVFIVDYQRMDATFPRLMNIIQNKTYRWLSDRYAWQMADIPEMVYFKYNNASFDQNTAHFWILEYDIGWRGLLPDLLLHFEQFHHWYLAESCDLNDKEWNGWYHRYKKAILNSEFHLMSYHCLIPLTRYNHRALQSMIDQINNDAILYCELRGTNAVPFEMWGDMYKLAPHLIDGSRFSWHPLSGVTKTKQDWDRQTKEGFYHPLKF